MMKKKKRKFFRATLLLIMFSAVGYTLYLNFGKDKAVVQAGSIAPDFKLETLEGKSVKLSDYRGQGVFLNFWGSWCKPCEKEMPYMENQYQAFKDQGIEILALNIGESNFIAQKFVEEHNLSFPILMDRDREITQLYGITPIPTTFLIDKSGKVLKVITGSMTEANVKKYMEMIKP
jgi:peroxiredoxin